MTLAPNTLQILVHNWPQSNSIYKNNFEILSSAVGVRYDIMLRIGNKNSTGLGEQSKHGISLAVSRSC